MPRKTQTYKNRKIKELETQLENIKQQNAMLIRQNMGFYGEVEAGRLPSAPEKGVIMLRTDLGEFISIDYMNEMFSIMNLFNATARTINVAVAGVEGQRRARVIAEMQGQLTNAFLRFETLLKGYGVMPDEHDSQLNFNEIRRLVIAYEEAIVEALSSGNYQRLDALAKDPGHELLALVLAEISNTPTRGATRNEAADWYAEKATIIREKYQTEHGKAQRWEDTFEEMRRLIDFESPGKAWATQIRNELDNAIKDSGANVRLRDQVKKAIVRRGKSRTV